MSSKRFTERSFVTIAFTLAIVCGVACWVCTRQIESTRHNLVERRLRTAVEILREPAAAALNSVDARQPFIEALNNWGRVTGLRLTLIAPDGSVLADTEVAEMPNILDRPEVRAANAGKTATEFRRSAVTGKDTLYVAAPVERDGVRIGTLRAATYASEIDGALAGIEITFALIAGCCLIAGTLIGVGIGRGKRANVRGVVRESADAERVAA